MTRDEIAAATQAFLAKGGNLNRGESSTAHGAYVVSPGVRSRGTRNLSSNVTCSLSMTKVRLYFNASGFVAGYRKSHQRRYPYGRKPMAPISLDTNRSL